MNNFNFDPSIMRKDVTNTDEGLNAFFKKVYSYMAIAVLVTAVTGFIVQRFFAYQMAMLFSNMFGFIIFIGIELLLVTLVGRRSFTNPASAFGMLMVYAVAQGLFLGVLLAIYTPASVFGAFLASAGIFGTMALLGFFSKKSLAGKEPIIIGSVVGLIIASLVAMVLHSSFLSLVISVIAVLLFAGITFYDNNRLKSMYYQVALGQSEEMTTGLAVSGALTLYLDFINIFFNLIRIMGNVRD